LFTKRSVKRNKFRKAVFITITVLIAIGLVIPLAGLFQNQPDNGGAQTAGLTGQTPLERINGLEARVRENPADTAALLELAEAYRYAGKPDRALKTYEQVLKLEPDNATARLEMAYIYFYSDKNDQAIAQLQELIKKEPDHKEAHLLYGYVLGAGKKDYQAGVQELEKFVALAGEGQEVEQVKQTINEWKAAAKK